MRSVLDVQEVTPGMECEMEAAREMLKPIEMFIKMRSGRYSALALTHLEMCSMWMSKSIINECKI